MYVLDFANIVSLYSPPDIMHDISLLHWLQWRQHFMI